MAKSTKTESTDTYTKRCRSCGEPFTCHRYTHDDLYREFCDDKCKETYKQKCRQEAIKKEMAEIIPLKFQSIDTSKTKILEDCYGKSVCLTGGVGTGKTVFACSLLKKYIQDRKECIFISFPAWIMKLQSSFRYEDSDPFEYAKEIALFEGILCIDDLGAEKLTDFVRQITYYIVNEREQRMLITIITSNFSLDEIDNQIDSRISSRIAGMCQILNLKGEDKRLIKKEKDKPKEGG